MVKFEIDLNTDSASQMSAAALFFETLARSATNELPAQPVEMTTDEAPESASDGDLQNLITREELDRRADLMRPYIVYIRRYEGLLHSEDFENEFAEIVKGAIAEQRFKAEQAAEEEARKEAKRKRDRERRATKKAEQEKAEDEAKAEYEAQAAEATKGEATETEDDRRASTDEPSEVTYNDVRAAISAKQQSATGSDKAEITKKLKEVVASFGVKLAVKLDPSDWAEAVKKINAVTL